MDKEFVWPSVDTNLAAIDSSLSQEQARYVLGQNAIDLLKLDVEGFITKG